MLPAVQLAKHKSAGAGEPDTDFILYVIADPGSCSSASTIAWAMFLDVDQTVGSLSAYRPIAGITNVCQLGIDTLALSSNAALQSTVDTMTHEILHALARVAAAGCRCFHAAPLPSMQLPPLLNFHWPLAGCRVQPAAQHASPSRP
jgi:hypothetical protein